MSKSSKFFVLSPFLVFSAYRPEGPVIAPIIYRSNRPGMPTGARNICISRKIHAIYDLKENHEKCYQF